MMKTRAAAPEGIENSGFSTIVDFDAEAITRSYNKVG
jgi:hypothetical protein